MATPPFSDLCSQRPAGTKLRFGLDRFNCACSREYWRRPRTYIPGKWLAHDTPW
jgi:hypothetical protein